MKYPIKCLEGLTTFFMSTWWGDSKNMEEIEFSRWLFEGRLRQGKKLWIGCAVLQVAQKAIVRIQFFHIFGIPSSRHEKHCQILQTLSWVFQYSRNSQWLYIITMSFLGANLFSLFTSLHKRFRSTYIGKYSSTYTYLILHNSTSDNIGNVLIWVLYLLYNSPINVCTW